MQNLSIKKRSCENYYFDLKKYQHYYSRSNAWVSYRVKGIESLPQTQTLQPVGVNLDISKLDNYSNKIRILIYLRSQSLWKKLNSYEI